MAMQYQKSFRHRTVQQFKVGRFHFKGGILLIKSDDEADFVKQLAEFEGLWKGLHPADRDSIKALRVVSNEESVEDGIARVASRAVHGAVGTNDIADRPADSRVGEKEVINPLTSPGPAEATGAAKPAGGGLRIG